MFCFVVVVTDIDAVGIVVAVDFQELLPGHPVIDTLGCLIDRFIIVEVIAVVILPEELHRIAVNSLIDIIDITQGIVIQTEIVLLGLIEICQDGSVVYQHHPDIEYHQYQDPYDI